MWHHRHYWELKSTLYQNSTYKNVHLFCCSSTSTTRGSKNPTRFDPSLTPGLYVSLDLWHRHKQLLPLNTDLTGWQHDWSQTDYFYWFWKNISKTLSCFGTPWQRERERERIKPNSTYSFHLGKEIPNWIIGNSILIIYADPHLQFLYPEPEEPNDARWPAEETAESGATGWHHHTCSGQWCCGYFYMLFIIHQPGVWLFPDQSLNLISAGNHQMDVAVTHL